MRKLFALMTTSFAFIAIAAGVARADELKLYEFNFQCEFGSNAPASVSSHEPRYCEAAAQVFAWVDPDDWMSSLKSQRDTLNKFAVECDNELVYANTATLDPGKRFVTITGITGDPILKIERDEHGLMSAPKGDEFESFLKIGDDKLKGKCKVRSEPVHGDDHRAN